MVIGRPHKYFIFWDGWYPLVYVRQLLLPKNIF
jgi:hypothetical protein